MQFKDTFFTNKKTINIKGKLIDFSSPLVMGILNITPDSFYDGGHYVSEQALLEQINRMITEGADIIDIGAASSRPGADLINAEQELARLEPSLKLINKHFPDLIMSVDTYHSEVARRVVGDFGVAMINDISAGEMDYRMFETIAEINVPYVIMHMQGNPTEMQNNPQYDNLLIEVFDYFSKKIHQLTELGVNDLIIDPGFGFGKTTDHNYELFNRLESFKISQLPLMVGISRKSMLFKLLQNTPQECLNATTVLNTIALQKGANILRVHDVKEAREAVTIVQKLKSFS